MFFRIFNVMVLYSLIVLICRLETTHSHSLLACSLTKAPDGWVDRWVGGSLGFHGILTSKHI